MIGYRVVFLRQCWRFSRCVSATVCDGFSLRVGTKLGTVHSATVSLAVKNETGGDDSRLSATNSKPGPAGTGELGRENGDCVLGSWELV
jgi:hypothetical protein